MKTGWGITVGRMVGGRDWDWDCVAKVGGGEVGREKVGMGGRPVV